MVPSWANQLLLQLLMGQFDILPKQCRHIEHIHEGVWLKKKYLNYNLPSFFTDSYCAGGI